MKLKESVQRHPLTSYFVLAYGLPWTGILLLLASKGFRFAEVKPSDGVLMFLLLILGPSLSSLSLLALLEGKTGLGRLWQRLTHWRLGWPWYAVALLTVPALVLVILLVLSRTVSPSFAPNFQLTGLLIGCLAGGLEEIGWTGFATPLLLDRHSPLKAGLVLGVAWALWHMLADFSSNITTMGALWPAWFILFWLLPLTAYRILMTWVYANGRSLLVAQLMHASYTGWLLTLSPTLSTGLGLVWQTTFAACLWIAVAGLAYASRQQWVHGRALSAARLTHPLEGKMQ
jgi:membrane protease YdiL (CAAX protease family)